MPKQKTSQENKDIPEITWKTEPEDIFQMNNSEAGEGYAITKAMKS